jgi:hypothetical protein
MADMLNDHDAGELLSYILEALRSRQLTSMADQLAAAASNRIVAEIDNRQLEHLPKSVRGELSTKSVREKSQAEQLMTVVSTLDAQLRQVPSVAEATAAGLDVSVGAIRFAYDETAIETSAAQPESEFRLTDLVWAEDEAAVAMNALAILWSGLGRDTRPQRSPEGAWLL